MCWFTGRVTHYLPFVMAIDIHICVYGCGGVITPWWAKVTPVQQAAMMRRYADSRRSSVQLAVAAQ